MQPSVVERDPPVPGQRERELAVGGREAVPRRVEHEQPITDLVVQRENELIGKARIGPDLRNGLAVPDQRPALGARRGNGRLEDHRQQGPRVVRRGNDVAEERERAPFPPAAGETSNSRPAAGNQEDDQERERGDCEERCTEREQLPAVGRPVDITARDDGDEPQAGAGRKQHVSAAVASSPGPQVVRPSARPAQAHVAQRTGLHGSVLRDEQGRARSGRQVAQKGGQVLHSVGAAEHARRPDDRHGVDDHPGRRDRRRLTARADGDGGERPPGRVSGERCLVVPCERALHGR